MRILFVGGTGNISSACVQVLAERGADLTVLNRGLSGALPDGVRRIVADIRDPHSYADALRGERFDVVVEWMAFVPEHVRLDLELCAGVSQYVFISSATVYEKPSPAFPLVEEAPLGNRSWQYARDKIACEELLRESGAPFTIVRPSYTYGGTWIPTAMEGVGWTVVDRLRRGRPMIVPGDGTSVWTLTHASDLARALAGILGREDAVGEAFHITSDEVLTWNQIAATIAVAAGFEPHTVAVSSELMARVEPDFGPGLLGDKSHSLAFDNAKIKRFVPGWQAEVPLAEGVARSLAWFAEDPARQIVDAALDVQLDRILAAHERALSV